MPVLGDLHIRIISCSAGSQNLHRARVIFQEMMEKDEMNRNMVIGLGVAVVAALGIASAALYNTTLGPGPGVDGSSKIDVATPEIPSAGIGP